MIEYFSLPFVHHAVIAAFIFAGIHAYLGFHIVSRGVIFVDLSLAQAAAFGSIVALLFGLEEDRSVSYFISLSFTLICAYLVSIARTKDNRINQEAFIGIIYVAFAAGMVLLLSKRAEGLNELNHIIAGSLLTVKSVELYKIAILYTLVGAFHFYFRERFFTISENHSKQNKNVKLWDFLFYSSLGVVVTSSVAIAGIMLVFSFLVIPPVVGLLFSKVRTTRLLIGWFTGFLGAIVGILLSLWIDLPPGPSIVIALVLLFLISNAFRLFIRVNG